MKYAERTPAAGFNRRGKPNAPRPLTPAERQRIEELVAELIELLDEADGDPEAEPSLGWWSTQAATRFDQQTNMIDLEEEHEGHEPSLCGLTFGDGVDDREQDLSVLEPYADREPWLAMLQRPN